MSPSICTNYDSLYFNIHHLITYQHVRCGVQNFTVKMYRTLLAILLCLAIGQTHTKSQKRNLTKFPHNFKFGVSTTAYQIEGAWNAEGKGESIWDHAVHTKPHKIRNRHNGDESCDSYHLYERDVEMLRELDVDFYRFSISWPRILPTGFTDHISTDAVAYYNNLINELVRYNITPVVTMYSWDLPHSLQDLGGWVNPLIESWFKNYAKVLFQRFGDRVKKWITINGPHAICHEGYGEGKLAPFLHSSGVGEYHCSYNLLKAHAAVYNLYEEDFKRKQKGSIGISLQIGWSEPLTMSLVDTEAVQDYKLFEHGIYLNPILKGDFPSKVKERIAKKSMEQGYKTSRLPKFTSEEVKIINGTADFIGLSHYTTVSIYKNSSLEGKYNIPSWLDDFGGGVYHNRKYKSAATEWLKVNPSGIRKVLNYLKDEYNNPEILIVENGYSTKRGLRDERRIQYIRNYLAQVLKAVLEDRVNVSGYAVFSLMDNFEWTDGYDIRFGLYEVDYGVKEKERIARKSALIYKEIIRSRVIDYRYRPIYHVVSKRKTQVQYFTELVSSTGLDMSNKNTRTFAGWMRNNMLLPLIKNVNKNKNATVNKPNIFITPRAREWGTNELDLKLNISNINNETLIIKNEKKIKPFSNISNTNNTPKWKSTYVPISKKDDNRTHNRTGSQIVPESSVNKTHSDILVKSSTNEWHETKLEHVPSIPNSNNTQKRNESKLQYDQTISIKNDTGEQKRNDSHSVPKSSVNKTQSERVLNNTVANSTNEWQKTKLKHITNVSNINDTQKRNESVYVPSISTKNDIWKQNETDSHKELELSVNKTQSEHASNKLTTKSTNERPMTKLEQLQSTHNKKKTDFNRVLNLFVANATHVGKESKINNLLNGTFTNSTNRKSKTEFKHPPPPSTTNSTLLGNKTKTLNLQSFSITNGSFVLNKTKLGPKINLRKTNHGRKKNETQFHKISETNGTLLSNGTKPDKLLNITVSNVTHNLNKTSSEPVRKVSTLNATFVHNSTRTEHVPNINFKIRTNGQNRTNSVREVQNSTKPNISKIQISRGQNKTKINSSIAVSGISDNAKVLKPDPAHNISIVISPNLGNKTILGTATSVIVATSNNTHIQ